jgi:hypothetical protein
LIYWLFLFGINMAKIDGTNDTQAPYPGEWL